VDRHLFNYHMAKNGDTQKTIAIALGITSASVSHKVSGVRGDFTRKEIAILSERWSLSGEDVKQIFLA